ncbi:MAG: hypothetical protein K2X49_29420 [Acetobacteraceae bacterium]|nr:hypothetical protein [Acetobacteraceae bacterium]
MTILPNDHDDGLVHGHRWATEPTPPHARRAETTRPSQPDHDDGLVHGHAWACGERGRMAGR